MRIARLSGLVLLFIVSIPAWGLKSKDIAVTFDIGVSATGAGFTSDGGESIGEALYGDGTLFSFGAIPEVGYGLSARVGVAYFVNRFLSIGGAVEYAYHPFPVRYTKETATDDLLVSSDLHLLKFPVTVTGYFLPFFVSSGVSVDKILYGNAVFTTGGNQVGVPLVDVAVVVPSFLLELGLAFDPTPASRLTASVGFDQALTASFSLPHGISDVAPSGLSVHVGYLFKWGE